MRLIEQTKLPDTLEVLEVRSVEQMFDAIRRLAVRGAPAIGIAAAIITTIAAVISTTIAAATSTARVIFQK